jgi:hypothetical protein
MADIVFPGQSSGILGRESLPSNYDLELYRGDYFSTSIVLKDSTGVVLNLSGYTAKCSIRTSFSATESFDATCTITAAEGRVDILFPSSVTETIAAGDYIWDFQVTNPDGNVRTYLAGDVKVWDEVTK